MENCKVFVKIENQGLIIESIRTKLKGFLYKIETTLLFFHPLLHIGSTKNNPPGVFRKSLNRVGKFLKSIYYEKSNLF
jgi:hypothetical protein